MLEILKVTLGTAKAVLQVIMRLKGMCKADEIESLPVVLVRCSQAQWTARHFLGGFSISFFWPALEKNQPVKNSKKLKRAKVKPVSKPDSDQASVIHLKPVDVD